MNFVHWLKLAGLTIAYLIVNVGVSFLVVAVYSFLINPGHPPEFYQDWATQAAPWSSIIAGIPLMFGLTWWWSRGKSWPEARRDALVIWVMYVVIDLAVLFSSGMTGRLGVVGYGVVIDKIRSRAVWGEKGVRLPVLM